MQVTAAELRVFLASHYLPSRMVLTGVNVDHQQLVALGEQHFVNPQTSWEGIQAKNIDQSIAQFNSFDIKVSVKRLLLRYM